jgi:hypothetical protein
MIIPVNTQAQYFSFQDRLFAAGFTWKYSPQGKKLAMGAHVMPLVLHCDLDTKTLTWEGLQEPASALELVLNITG